LGAKAKAGAGAATSQQSTVSGRTSATFDRLFVAFCLGHLTLPLAQSSMGMRM